MKKVSCFEKLAVGCLTSTSSYLLLVAMAHLVTLDVILDHVGVEYTTNNVLDDNEIREGVKVFSNWPTIPQLYVNGEFIGGADIMREMFESGELKQLLEQVG